MSAEPKLRAGSICAELRAEFPDLAILQTAVAARARRTPPELRARLRQASDRFTGSKAIVLRQQPVPWAYRVFFRHIGIDPDERRTPIEALAVERLRAGGFQSDGLLADALLLATLETGVPVDAYDGARVVGAIGLRLARGEERLGGSGLPLVERQIVVCDDQLPLAVLFGEVSPDHRVGKQTEQVLLTAIQVKGVPDVSVEEALWTATDIIAQAGAVGGPRRP